jgi:hypothetical protein
MEQENDHVRWIRKGFNEVGPSHFKLKPNHNSGENKLNFGKLRITLNPT